MECSLLFFYSQLYKVPFCSCGLFACSQPCNSAHRTIVTFHNSIIAYFQKKKETLASNMCLVASSLPTGQDWHSHEHHRDPLHHAVHQQLGTGHVSPGLLPCLGQCYLSVKGNGEEDPWESAQGCRSCPLCSTRDLRGTRRHQENLADWERASESVWSAVVLLS